MASDGGGRIKLFKFIQRTCKDIGLIPDQSNQNHSPINAKIYLFLFCHAQFSISTAAYLFFEANTIIEYGMLFYICISIVLLVVLYMTLLWQLQNILNFIENCEQFIEKRTHSMILYKETTEKIERLTEFFASAMFVTGIMIVLPPLLYTIVNYYILDSGKESFFLFAPTWWPFDWKTPFGYLVAWIAQSAFIVCIMITATLFFGIIYGSNWLFVVLAEDITNDVVVFNNTVKALKQEDNDRVKLLVCRFCDIIEHYTDVKRCVSDFYEIHKYSLFAFFSWDLLATASVLMTLQFQLWDNESNSIETIILSLLISWAFEGNLVICELGERVTIQFDQFGVEFARCDWNKLPIKLQRMYLSFLSDTQQPKNIRTYAGIHCTRETFKGITTKGFSYFMTLRKFRA